MNTRALFLAATTALMAQPALAQSARFGGFSVGASFSSAEVSGAGQGGGTAVASPSGTTRGAFGINLGYNWALGDTFLLGVAGNFASLSGPNGGRGGPNIRNMAALRVQAGYAFGDTAVFFGIGSAQGQIGGGGNVNAAAASQQGGNTHRGTVASFGIQHALSENLSLQVEYSAYRFNSGGGNGGGGGGHPTAQGAGGGGPRSDLFTVGFALTF